MTDNAPQQDRQRILDDIEQYGCHLVLIEADNYMPAFAYSVGFYHKFGHPEIICFGLTTESMGNLLNNTCELIKKGEKLEINKGYAGFITNHDIQFLAVDKEFYTSYLGYAGSFYNWSFDFPVLQIVWPDKENNFPWDEKFNSEWKFKQPLLDRNMDFKFYEERNVAVFTSKQVLDGDPILYVHHDNDGNWQFQGSAETGPDDVIVVSLESITKLDPSVNEIYHLQYGWNAWREGVNEAWEFEEGEEDEEDEEEV